MSCVRFPGYGLSFDRSLSRGAIRRVRRSFRAPTRVLRTRPLHRQPGDNRVVQPCPCRHRVGPDAAVPFLTAVEWRLRHAARAGSFDWASQRATASSMLFRSATCEVRAACEAEPARGGTLPKGICTCALPGCIGCIVPGKMDGPMDCVSCAPGLGSGCTEGGPGCGGASICAPTGVAITAKASTPATIDAICNFILDSC